MRARARAGGGNLPLYREEIFARRKMRPRRLISRDEKIPVGDPRPLKEPRLDSSSVTEEEETEAEEGERELFFSQIDYRPRPRNAEKAQRGVVSRIHFVTVSSVFHLPARPVLRLSIHRSWFIPPNEPVNASFTRADDV